MGPLKYATAVINTIPDLTVYRNLSVTTTGAVVSAVACKLHRIDISNGAAAIRYLKVYDKATAATEADTPVFTFRVNANREREINLPKPVAFTNGISIRASNAVADNDTTNTTANDVIVHIYTAGI